MLLAVLISCNEVNKDTNANIDTDSQIIDTGSDKSTDTSTDTDITGDNQGEIKKITDFPQLADMQTEANKIEIYYKPAKQAYKQIIEDEGQIKEIMSLLFEGEFEDVGQYPPPGGYTRLTVTQGDKEFVITDCMEYENSIYQMRNGRLDNKIREIVFTYADLFENVTTVNSFEKTHQKSNYYYEPLILGTYLGDNVPRSNSTGFYKDFDFGWYYQVIKSYEELTTLVENPENVDEDVFSDCCILLISYYETTTSRYLIEGFKNLTYNKEEKKLSITADGFTNGNVGEAESVYNIYLAIPKTDSVYNQLIELDYGILDFNINEYSGYESYTYKADSEALTAGTVCVFDNLSGLEKYLNELDIEMKAPFKYYTEYETDYFFVVAYTNKCSFCSKYIGYKNLFTDGQSLYITLQKRDKHSGSCFGENMALNIICVNKYENGQESIYKELSQSPDIVVLVEEIATNHLTEYSLIEKSEYHRYNDGFFLEQ